MNESPVERLIQTNPDMEIWWDSSPLIFDQWVEKMVNAAPPDRKATMREQLLRLYNAEHPEQSVFRGCTTNPPLSWGAVQADPKFWGDWVSKLCKDNPKLSQKRLAILTYKEIVRRGAEKYLPIWKDSHGRFGWISAQLDPRLFSETEAMLEGAEEFSAIGENVMIKVPASMQGMEVLKIINSKGISTNTTTCFTLPQIMASADATMEGIKIAEKNKVDMSKWRAVITMMIGRLTENEALDLQAERKKIKLSWQEKHWFGIAVFRRAYRLLTEGGYASKLLSCSMRAGPLVAGKMRYWDIQKVAGGDIVYTCPPYVLEPLFLMGDDIDFRPEIEEEVPQAVLDKMLTLPYCIQAYDPNGLSLEQFNIHPATVATVETFAKGFSSLEAFVGERMVHPVAAMA
ncbi:MAG TPA: transaldolase family protein [Anaerolineales bacterium]|nr:transaldolase family protein [Anaerolineales bacterium]